MSLRKHISPCEKLRPSFKRITILLVIVSVQLISLLKQLKNEHSKEIKPIVKNPENLPAGGKKMTKKRVSLTVLLEKMKNRIAHPHSAKKKFFKS